MNYLLLQKPIVQVFLIINNTSYEYINNMSGLEKCNGEKSFRLREFGTKYKNLGRLETCYDGYWGSVCDDIDYVNQLIVPSAKVACKELGYYNVVKGLICCLCNYIILRCISS